MGQIKMSYHNTEICIYNLERMLIELVRFRGKLPLTITRRLSDRTGIVWRLWILRRWKSTQLSLNIRIK